MKIIKCDVRGCTSPLLDEVKLFTAWVSSYKKEMDEDQPELGYEVDLCPSCLGEVTNTIEGLLK